jgi:hypothetical protein
MRFADGVLPRDRDTDTLVYAHFRGQGEASAPLTWAQVTMWRGMAISRQQFMFLNLRRVLPVSTRVAADVATVSRAIGALMSRHGALRTRVREIDGELRQETAAEGEAPILVVEADPAGDPDGSAEAARLTARLGDVDFDHDREWPQRFALVAVNGRVRQIALVLSHSTADAYAVDILLQDLRLLLLRGSLPTPAGLQSVDIGRRQQGPDQRRSARAIEFWTRQYERLPGPVIAERHPELDPRLHRGTLVSRAIGLAARTLAARYRVTASAVLLAATTAVAAGPGEQPICGLFTMSHNRFRAQDANAIVNIGQIGFCVLDISHRPSFAELVSCVWKAALDGYSHAYYDAAAMRRAFEERGIDYTTAFLPYLYFNDVRIQERAGDQPVDIDADVLRRAMDSTTFAPTRGIHRASWHFLNHVVDDPGGVGITLSLDTRFHAPDEMEPILRTVEELLVEAVTHDVRWPWSHRR